jgi:hypothetical protein
VPSLTRPTLVLAVVWPSGGGLEQPFRTVSVENAGCATPTPHHCCYPCARTAISLHPWLWSVAGDVDANSATNGLFVDRPGETAALPGRRGVGIDHRRGLPRANGINARGVGREASETFEFRAVPLLGGPGEDMRRHARTRAAVRADPSLSHIWAGNGSTGPRLSVCVGPLGCVFPIFISARTRSDARWSNGLARWRCP